jgi:hypothetical protein
MISSNDIVNRLNDIMLKHHMVILTSDNIDAMLNKYAYNLRQDDLSFIRTTLDKSYSTLISINDDQSIDSHGGSYWKTFDQMMFDSNSSLFNILYDAHLIMMYIKSPLQMDNVFGSANMTMHMSNAFKELQALRHCKSKEELVIEMDVLGI